MYSIRQIHFCVYETQKSVCVCLFTVICIRKGRNRLICSCECACAFQPHFDMFISLVYFLLLLRMWFHACICCRAASVYVIKTYMKLLELEEKRERKLSIITRYSPTITFIFFSSRPCRFSWQNNIHFLSKFIFLISANFAFHWLIYFLSVFLLYSIRTKRVCLLVICSCLCLYSYLVSYRQFELSFFHFSLSACLLLQLTQ